MREDVITLENIMRREVETRGKPTTLYERNAMQISIFRKISAVYGLPLTVDRIEYWGTIFARIVPHSIDN